MTEKGFSVSEIIEEINTKLLKVLPRGLFLAAAFIEYSQDSRKISLWNAGMPDVFVFDGDGTIKLRMPSQHWPLGINPELTLGQAVEVMQLEEGDHVLMMTDGLVEAKNASQEQYGMGRVERLIGSKSSGWKADNIYSDLSSFVGKNLIVDDTTLVEINMNAMTKPIEARKVQTYPTPVQNAEWKMNYVFGPEILRQHDPLPNIVTTLMAIQKLHKYKQDIFIIIKELFVNAVDHGLLKLESKIKSGPTGFSEYINERQKRLNDLEQGVISLEFIHQTHPKGGILDVYVYDSGEGFDVHEISSNPGQDSTTYHGRGLLLVKDICESLDFNEKGNEVHARYFWRNE